MAKILVADDNSNIQKMVTLALKDQGIDVVSVGNGEAAVRKLPDVSPDLVLADIFMPVRNGYEVCEFVKQDARFANIPVILLVGAFDPLDETEVQRVGADGVLKKPFVPPEPLIAMVKSMLERSSGSSAEPVPVGTTRVASPATASSTSDAKPAPPSVEPPGPVPASPAPASFEGETDEYIEPLTASPFAEPNLGFASESEEDTEPGAPGFRGAAIGDQLWATYGETEKAGEESGEKEVGPLEDLLSRQEKAGPPQPLELVDVQAQDRMTEVVETQARATEAPEERQPTRLDHDAAGGASSEKPESDSWLNQSTKPASMEWRESWAAKESDPWVEKSGGSAPVDKPSAAHEENPAEDAYPGIDLNETLAAIRAAHGLRPAESPSASEPPAAAEPEHAEGIEKFVQPGIFGQAIPFQRQAGGEAHEETSEAGSAVPAEKPWPGVPEPPPLPMGEESRTTELEPAAHRGGQPRTPAGWLDALSPATPKGEPTTEPARLSSLAPASTPAEPGSAYRPAPSEAAPKEQGPAAPSDGPTDEAAIQAAVDKVIERMQGQMLDVVTREVLRPVVEALVRRELKKP